MGASQVPADLTLDFSRVEVLDPLAVAMLVAGNRSCEMAGGRLHLKGVGERVMGTLTTLGLDRCFDIEVAKGLTWKMGCLQKCPLTSGHS